MNEKGDKYYLELEGVKIAELVLDHVSQPLFICEFKPCPDFDKYIPLFETDGFTAGDYSYMFSPKLSKTRKQNLILKRFDGKEPDVLILHIKGHEAWFRGTFK